MATHGQYLFQLERREHLRQDLESAKGTRLTGGAERLTIVQQVWIAHKDVTQWHKGGPRIIYSVVMLDGPEYSQAMREEMRKCRSA